MRQMLYMGLNWINVILSSFHNPHNKCIHNPLYSFIDIINQFSNKLNYCLIYYHDGWSDFKWMKMARKNEWTVRYTCIYTCECHYNSANENQLGDTSILAHVEPFDQHSFELIANKEMYERSVWHWKTQSIVSLAISTYRKFLKHFC